jgi:hypothetical protein
MHLLVKTTMPMEYKLLFLYTRIIVVHAVRVLIMSYYIYVYIYIYITRGQPLIDKLLFVIKYGDSILL